MTVERLALNGRTAMSASFLLCCGAFAAVGCGSSSSTPSFSGGSGAGAGGSSANAGAATAGDGASLAGAAGKPSSGGASGVDGGASGVDGGASGLGGAQNDLGGASNGTAGASNGTAGSAGASPGLGCSGDETGGLPKGSTQLARLCARGYVDPISKAFCGSAPPTITSLTDVLKTVGLAFAPPLTNPPNQFPSGHDGNPAFIVTVQSSSISTRTVSQLNPRAIIFTPPLARGRLMGAPSPDPSYVALGFTRGDQAVELVAKDPANGGLRFFLLKYLQACNSAPGGCTPGDLYTPAVESKFASWSLYDEEDLKNTPLDCRQCHQPSGPGTKSMLRMQELQRPWQHWLYKDALGVAAISADFHGAHGTQEAYGGIPAYWVDHGDVQQLEALVENNGFLAQPNEFASVAIAAELKATGSSATWQALYQGAKSGQFIPVPYYDVLATDPVKVKALTQQYTAVMAGTLPASKLGDLSDIFTDASQRAMTHKPALGLDGRQTLVQVCQQCHNSRLDQSISRASFNVERLDLLSRGEKDEAIRRINLPKGACEHMPPNRFRELDAAEIARVQTELRK